jgi:hypothetical protein
MNKQDITILIDNKIKENGEKVVFKFYEMKVERNLTDKELLSTLNLISIRLNNLGYKVYRTGQKYNYKNQKFLVEINELMIGIKNN